MTPTSSKHEVLPRVTGFRIPELLRGWPYRVARIALAVTVLIAAEDVQLLHGIAYSLICFGLLIWCLFDRTSLTPLKMLAFTAGSVVFYEFLRYYFQIVDRIVPLKYDYVLENIDDRWLFDGTVCQTFAHQLKITWDVTLLYDGLGIAAIFWYGWLLTKAQQKAPRFIKALLIAYGVGPLFYFLVPACGPLYVNNSHGVGLLLLHGWPNCWPSLHLVTALLFFYYRPGGTTAIVASVFMVLGTAFTTLATGQHYAIDLLAAIPFSGFIWATIAGHQKLAAGLLFGVLMGAIWIHFAI
jgi:hypothetical protein